MYKSDTTSHEWGGDASAPFLYFQFPAFIFDDLHSLGQTLSQVFLDSRLGRSFRSSNTVSFTCCTTISPSDSQIAASGNHCLAVGFGSDHPCNKQNWIEAKHFARLTKTSSKINLFITFYSFSDSLR